MLQDTQRSLVLLLLLLACIRDALKTFIYNETIFYYVLASKISEYDKIWIYRFRIK